MPSDPTAENEAVSPASERTTDPVVLAQRLLSTVAVLAVIGTVLALLLTQRLGTTYRDGLAVTADGAEVAALGASSAEDLAVDLLSLADSAGASLEQARDLVLVASDVTADLGTALGTNVADGVAGTSSIADRMAGFIETIERFIPGDSDSLAEDLRTLSDGLEPVPDQLRSLASQLEDSSAELDAAAASLDDIADQLAALSASVDEARVALAEVETLSVDVAARANAALDRSGTDLWLVRLLLLVIGLGVAGAAIAGHRAVDLLAARGEPGAGGGTRTHTPSGTGT
jgi:methyl-accepting chemotaxis protein